MLSDQIDVIRCGDNSGNNMIIRITLSSGRRIYGFATSNQWTDDWNSGPTWNYLVTGDRLFLVDSGKRGEGLQLFKMIESAGFSPRDIHDVIVSHGHEDHDGGLYELAGLMKFRVMAHEIYGCMVTARADAAPPDHKAQFPASCWCCPMPESFSRESCLEYHKERQQLCITAIGGNAGTIPDIEIFHTPGHSPDSVALLIDGEALLPGDTILPEITPHPTTERDFLVKKPVLPDKWREAQQLFGLRAYIRSLKMLKSATGASDRISVLPGHRLYYRGRFNRLDLNLRVKELVQHHVDRCHAFAAILKNGPKTPEELAREYFEPGLLKAYGINLAVNEVRSHIELMEISNDVAILEDGKMASNGSENFQALINGIGGGCGGCAA